MVSRVRTWLQLFRAPNLFTVPGDSLAGFVLSNYGVPTVEVFWAIGASLCFYSAGLLDNDLADQAEDKRERAMRPLPSGAAKPMAVSIVAIILSAIGLGLCFQMGTRSLIIGALLLVSIGLYNHCTKRIPVIGAINMGFCRALSVILGATAAMSQVVTHNSICFAVLIGLFIAAVTNLARSETKADAPAIATWLPPAALLIGLLIPTNWPLMGTGPEADTGTNLMRLLLLTAFSLSLLYQGRLPTPPVIGRLIRLLIPLQAAFCAYTGGLGLICAGLLLLLWPISSAVSKRFYAS